MCLNFLAVFLAFSFHHNIYIYIYIYVCILYYMQSLEEETSGTSISEQLLMNTEQVGILLVSTLNTSNNETVKTISNQNIG